MAPPVVRRSALCLLPVFALVCGAKIPFLVPAVTALFEQVTPMQVFRELYHLMIVPSLFYALGIAAAAGFLYDALPRVRYVLAALVVACVGVYVEPMLTGDVTGWLAAAPYDDYLRPAYLATERGAGRVAWFPMDQPLGFDDRGAGVDPMSLTPPGSLWQYSLRWPLTAVDMEAHEGDTEALRDGLRALGVTTAVQRDRFFSRFRDYAPEHPPGSSLWSRRVELAPALGERVDAGDGIAAFRIAGAAADGVRCGRLRRRAGALSRRRARRSATRAGVCVRPATSRGRAVRCVLRRRRPPVRSAAAVGRSLVSAALAR